MAPIHLSSFTTLSVPLAKRQYYYYTSPGLSTGAIAGISIASILLLVLAIAGCARRARYGSYYGPSIYQQPQPYAYRTADGQPVMPIYSTTSGNPAYPQTELGQVAPKPPAAAVISGHPVAPNSTGATAGVNGAPPMYGGANMDRNGYYAPPGRGK